MGKMFLAGTSAFIVFSAGLYLALERPAWTARVPEVLQSSEPPVMVFLVGNRGGVELMKRAVDPARIVAESPDAIALVEGRIIATSPSAVSDPIMQAGWSARRIEIFTLPKNDGLNRGRSASRQGRQRDPRMGRLMELINKPTLSQSEAVFALQAMDDGLL